MNKPNKSFGEEDNFSTVAETAVNENSIFNRFHLECIGKLHDKKEFCAGSAAYTDFFDQLLVGLLCSLFSNSECRGTITLLV